MISELNPELNQEELALWSEFITEQAGGKNKKKIRKFYDFFVVMIKSWFCGLAALPAIIFWAYFFGFSTSDFKTAVGNSGEDELLVYSLSAGFILVSWSSLVFQARSGGFSKTQDRAENVVLSAASQLYWHLSVHRFNKDKSREEKAAVSREKDLLGRIEPTLNS